MVGIAREVSTLYDMPLRYARGRASTATPATPAAARRPLARDHRGPRRSVRATPRRWPTSPSAPPPPGCVERLAAAGIRSISNIVDITNYVLLEIGQPMHAFDLAKLAGAQLRVRRATPGEKRADARRPDARRSPPDMLVIADAERAAAVAGVMGGADSEVSERDDDDRARERLLPPAVGAAHEQAAGTEDRGAYRFERGADPEAPPRGAGARVPAARGDWRRPRAPDWIDARRRRRARPVRCAAPRAHSRACSASTSPPSDVERILRALGFELSSTRRRQAVRQASTRR